MEAIKATIEGKGDGLRDLKKLMVDLDYESVADEITMLASIRKEFWKVRDRQRKAAAELCRAERAVDRIDLHAAQIDGKINRLKGYVRFIEGGWLDETLLTTSCKAERSDVDANNESNEEGNHRDEQPSINVNRKTSASR